MKNENTQAYDAHGRHIGYFDGEYLYTTDGRLTHRVDGDEVYSVQIPNEYVAKFENGVARDFGGSVLFQLN